MAKFTKPTPENRWNLSEEQIEAVREAYVDGKCSQQITSFRTGVQVGVVAMVCKHHKWTRSPWDRSRHLWNREVAGVAIAKNARLTRELREI